jgi:hypothetical protein
VQVDFVACAFASTVALAIVDFAAVAVGIPHVAELCNFATFDVVWPYFLWTRMRLDEY